MKDPGLLQGLKEDQCRGRLTTADQVTHDEAEEVTAKAGHAGSGVEFILSATRSGCEVGGF